MTVSEWNVVRHTSVVFAPEARAEAGAAAGLARRRRVMSPDTATPRLEELEAADEVALPE
jgi:hypothetical protein